jgi:hypothetical protein
MEVFFLFRIWREELPFCNGYNFLRTSLSAFKWTFFTFIDVQKPAYKMDNIIIIWQFINKALKEIPFTRQVLISICMGFLLKDICI